MSNIASEAPPAGVRLPPALRAFERVVASVTAISTAISAAGILVALAFVTYAVVLRYAFNAPSWVDDTVGFMLVGIVMLGAAATLRQGGHINVDMLTGHLKGGRRRMADAWSTLAVLVFAIVVVVNGWETAMSSRMLGVMTSGNVEIPVFWLQLLMPLGGVVLLLAALEALLRVALGIPLPHDVHLEDVE